LFVFVGCCESDADADSGGGGLVSIFVGGAGGYGGPDCRICGGTAGLAAE
jgi:hypothetical protein